MAIQYCGKDSKNMHVHLKNIEWESTVTIPITEETYNTKKANNNNKVDVIFFFDNDSRLASRKIERKITTSCRNLLSFYREQWFPIKRTTAIEELCSINSETNVTKALHRIIVHQEDGLRVSYNKEECDDGVKYTVQYEIEYPENTKYQDILLHERRLMKKIFDDKFPIQRNTMKLQTIFSCVMSKVQMWHCFDAEQEYIWAYKWNGVKSKLMITSTVLEDNTNLTYLWPDANIISTQRCSGKNLHLLIDLCFLVEIMDNDYIVIIEAIGTLVDDTIYTTEPMMNASILKYLKHAVEDLTICGKKVLIQEFYPAPMPKQYDTKCYDGFIIIQNDIVIKWKAPTIDIKCIDDYTYKVAGNILRLDHRGTIGCIYEMSWTKKILRQRNDRIAASCENEYKIYLQSIEMLHKMSNTTVNNNIANDDKNHNNAKDNDNVKCNYTSNSNI